MFSCPVTVCIYITCRITLHQKNHENNATLQHNLGLQGIWLLGTHLHRYLKVSNAIITKLKNVFKKLLLLIYKQKSKNIFVYYFFLIHRITVSIARPIPVIELISSKKRVMFEQLFRRMLLLWRWAFLGILTFEP